MTAITTSQLDELERNWLVKLLADVERRAAERPAWAMSEHAQSEIAKLRRGRTKP